MAKINALAPWIHVDDRLIFEPPYRGIRKRVKRPQMVVGHWTGGEGGADRIFRALQTRVDEDGEPSPLSVQFAIDGDGEAWQFCDPDRAVCFHAGAVNDESLGVEITNRGLPPMLSKRAREVISLPVHGRAQFQLAYTAKQLDTWGRLCDLLCDTYEIPRQVPSLQPGPASDRLMTHAERDAWEGVAEHLHFASKKTDGGTQLTRALLGRGYAGVDPKTLLRGKP